MSTKTRTSIREARDTARRDAKRHEAKAKASWALYKRLHADLLDDYKKDYR